MPSDSLTSDTSLIVVGDPSTSVTVQTKVIDTKNRKNSPTYTRRCIPKIDKKTNCTVIQVIILGSTLFILIILCAILETIFQEGTKETIDYGNNDVFPPLIGHDSKYHHDLVDYVNNLSNSTWIAKYNRYATQSKHLFHSNSTNIENIESREKSYVRGKTEKELIGNTFEHYEELINVTKNIILPKEFDSRLKWPYCASIHRVANQGGCGSCYASSSAAVISDRICIKTNGSFQPEISVQDLISCCTDCGACNGAAFAFSPINHWIQNGIVTGGSYGSFEGCKPYSVSPSCGSPCILDKAKLNRKMPCIKKCQKLYDKKYEDDIIKGSQGYWLRTGEQHEITFPKLAMLKIKIESTIGYIELLKRELYTYGPLLACLNIYDEFQHYSSGIYHEQTVPTSESLYGHCVKLLGWGYEGEKGFWIYANTWSREWGIGGFFKMNMEQLPEEVIGAIY
uniref:Pept_C1 domain-containing protein n=1 Tax=Parastrongyloides trichosuri TaxID=131310 RepID=A0A0N4Z8T7_PARTI